MSNAPDLGNTEEHENIIMVGEMSSPNDAAAVADLAKLTEEELEALHKQRATLPRERLEGVFSEIFRRKDAEIETLKGELKVEWRRIAGDLSGDRCSLGPDAL